MYAGGLVLAAAAFQQLMNMINNKVTYQVVGDIREEAYKEALEESVYNPRKEVEERYRNGEPLVFADKGTFNWTYWDVPKERSRLNFDWYGYDYMIISERDIEHYKKYTDRIKKTGNPEKFTKADNGKLQWSLMPFEQLEDVVRVLMNGAEKYSKDNWKKCDDTTRYVDALERHVVSYIKGEKIDVKEKGGDGLPHLAHAICNCLFLMWFDKQEIF